MKYDGNWLTESHGTILDLDEPSNNTTTAEVSVTLDRTVFHAQGGGQPTDMGQLIVEGKSSIDISKVLIDRSTGVASHLGLFAADQDIVDTAVSTPTVILDSPDPIWRPNYDSDDGLPSYICGADAFGSYFTLQQMQMSGKSGFRILRTNTPATAMRVVAASTKPAYTNTCSKVPVKMNSKLMPD